MSSDRQQPYAPIGLLALVLVWEVLMLLGFAAVFWGLQGGNFGQALALSGSSLFTLGTVKPVGGIATATNTGGPP